MFRYPYDIERFMPNNLAFSTNETCAVIAKFDKDYNIIGSTFWGGNELVLRATAQLLLSGAQHGIEFVEIYRRSRDDYRSHINGIREVAVPRCLTCCG